MFQTIEGFLKMWEHESKLTQKVLDQLTDESLKQEVIAENWKLGSLAWHLTTAIKGLGPIANLSIEESVTDSPIPTSAQFIAESYRKISDAFAQAIKTQWTDHTLNTEMDFFGQNISKGLFLMFLIQHQTHHRGQMTVLMRQAGLTVPGVYGPSKEEWENIKMEAQNK
jgi:uncharacterized damage-inducible protein DinB